MKRHTKAMKLTMQPSPPKAQAMDTHQMSGPPMVKKAPAHQTRSTWNMTVGGS